MYTPCKRPTVAGEFWRLYWRFLFDFSDLLIYLGTLENGYTLFRYKIAPNPISNIQRELLVHSMCVNGLN